MTIAWPQSLVPEIAERRCIVILGAGASAGCKSRDGKINPPNWTQLLNRAANLLIDPTDKALVASLVEKERYLDAAEIVVSKANPADYTGFVRDVFVDPHFGHSEIHEEIYKLDPVLSGYKSNNVSWLGKVDSQFGARGSQRAVKIGVFSNNVRLRICKIS